MTLPTARLGVRPCVIRCSALWTRAFASTTPARSKFQAFGLPPIADTQNQILKSGTSFRKKEKVQVES